MYRKLLALLAAVILGCPVASWLGAQAALADAGDIASWTRIGRGTVVWRITGGGSAYGHWIPGANATYDVGNSTRYVRNFYATNLTLAGTYAVDNIGATSNVTSVNVIASEAINGTGTATFGNVTTAGRSTAANSVVSGVSNVTGLTTLNTAVANSTVNVTGLLSLSAGLAYGGTSVNATNITLTASNATHVYLTNMTGNHTITLPAVAGCAGRQFRVVEVCNKWGGTGNVTFNVTSGGNVNLVDTYTPTNTSGASGNISQVIAECNGGFWSVGVVRR